jgi:cytochrome c5
VTVAHDKKFFDTFMLVLGILIAIAVVLYVLARIVAKDTQVAEVQASPEMRRAINERIAPIAKIAVAGQDNSALAPAKPAAGAQQDLGGEEVFNRACTAPESQGRRRSATPQPGDRALRKAPTRCTNTRSKASRAAPASCHRRAAQPTFRTSRS